MAHRTTLLMDEETRQAAKELSVKLGCSTSEAIRRSVLRYRDALKGVSLQQRKVRKKALLQLFELFKDVDANAEIRRLKEQDEYF